MTKLPSFDYAAYVCGLLGSTNPSSYGVWAYVFRSSGQDISKDSGIINSELMSNNTIEYLAAGKAIQAYAALGRSGPLCIATSSQLVAYQMQGLWSVKKGSYVQAYQSVDKLVSRCEFPIHWVWVPSTQNQQVIELATECMNSVPLDVWHYSKRTSAP